MITHSGSISIERKERFRLRICRGGGGDAASPCSLLISVGVPSTAAHICLAVLDTPIVVN